MRWKKFLTVLKAFLLLYILLPKLQLAAAQPLPANLFNIGNSIGEAEAAYDEIGVSNHETAWTTGYDRNDIVYSLNERFEDKEPTTFDQNNADRDALFNRAVSGSEMGNFAEQAEEVVAVSQTLPSKQVGRDKSNVYQFCARVHYTLHAVCHPSCTSRCATDW